MEKCKTCTRYVNGYCALTMALPNEDKCDYRQIDPIKLHMLMSKGIFHTEQEGHHCGECDRFAGNVSFPYCRAKDYYTAADKNDDACEYFVSKKRTATE